MAADVVPYAARLERGLYDLLKAAANDRRRSMASILNEALEDWLSKEKAT
jgi:hypothetical protein